MKLIITIVTFILLLTQPVPIYRLSVKSSVGAPISFSAFEGKKILIVNIATGSELASQLKTLQQLQDQYASSLIVIAFPSNSFGNEPKNPAELVGTCQSVYGVTFRITEKGDVTGSNMHPLYAWLTRKAENGDVNQDVKGDFQKYIISEKGQIIGVFKGSVKPDDPRLISILNTSSY